MVNSLKNSTKQMFESNARIARRSEVGVFLCINTPYVSLGHKMKGTHGWQLKTVVILVPSYDLRVILSVIVTGLLKALSQTCRQTGTCRHSENDTSSSFKR